jgi:ABC-type branched-subunit amino acid transport system substrate-binding protein
MLMLKKPLVALLVVAMSLALLAVACGASATATPAPTATPLPPPPLKIGQLNSFTGDLSDFGTAHRNSGALAADHVNQAGGVLGTVVTISARDTQTNPQVGVDAARALVDIEGVVAIVGALASGVTIPVVQSVTGPSGILQISAASTSPAITVLDDNDFMFRTTVSDAAQGVVLARLAKEQGFTSASALYINNAYGEGLADQFKETFEAEGGTVQELVAHEGTQPSYASELSKATEGGPDVLVAISYPESAEVYLREALEGDYISTFLFVDGTKSSDLNEAIGADNLEGTFGTAPGSSLSGARTAFSDAYTASFASVPPLPFMAETYDAVVLIALAAEKAGTTTDSAKIRDALRSVANAPGETVGPGTESIKHALELIRAGKDINYEGAGGSQDFDENGDVVSTIEIWKIEGGEIVSTGRFELP